MNIARRQRDKVIKATALGMIIAATTILIRGLEVRRNHRCWVRPWLRCKEKGNLNLVKEEFVEDAAQFKIFLRISEDCFNKLLQMVEGTISKHNTFFRDSITARDKLIITLRFLATGETYRSLMYSFRVSESTISLFVPVVCRAIYLALKDDYLNVPTTVQEWERISQEFETTWNLPNVVGAMDGKHVVFRPPRSAGSMYFNYKGDHSIVLFGVVDAKYNFIYIDVGVNSVSDGGVFRQSSLASALARNTLNIPPSKCLPNRNKPVPYVCVADAAFPLSELIMKPYPIRNMNHQQRIFNYRLSRARRVVENAFGILANRFRIFLTAIQLSPEKVQDITLACCALHNYLRAECSIFVQADEKIDGKLNFIHHLQHQAGNRARDLALEIREEFKEYINNEGSIPWQDDLI